MTNYNTADTAHRNFTDMVTGVTGDWYFNGDPTHGIAALQEHISDDDFSEPLEYFTDWNKANPDEQVTEQTIKDISGDLVQWYKDSFTLTGEAAIAEKEYDSAITLNKYADPIEGALEDISIEQARSIASVDPELVYCTDH